MQQPSTALSHMNQVTIKEILKMMSSLQTNKKVEKQTRKCQYNFSLFTYIQRVSFCVGEYYLVRKNRHKKIVSRVEPGLLSHM